MLTIVAEEQDPETQGGWGYESNPREEKRNMRNWKNPNKK
jgi:hypothetical protein